MSPTLPRLRSGLVLLCMLTLTLITLAGTVRAGDYAVYEADSSFEDVLDALRFGIEERGLYINNVMNMGEMLERTGQDLGADTQIFTRAESIEFCSAVLSRQMTSEDPRLVVNCPFIIAVYTLPDQPDTTYIAHRAIPPAETAASPAMQAVADMLKGLAEAAIAW